jgi:hypothetical protein
LSSHRFNFNEVVSARACPQRSSQERGEAEEGYFLTAPGPAPLSSFTTDSGCPQSPRLYGRRDSGQPIKFNILNGLLKIWRYAKLSHQPIAAQHETIEHGLTGRAAPAHWERQQGT